MSKGKRRYLVALVDEWVRRERSWTYDFHDIAEDNDPWSVR